MSTYEGTLRHEDLGPGAWILETRSGERITLMGEVPDALAGRQVRVQGREVEGMGITMAGGRMVEVRTISAS
ncbi:MAG: hypothetical protein KTR31_39635 [Myxococcales bacterium]|nr:hypothetical protein [Myxococcales bacterium]